VIAFEKLFLRHPSAPNEEDIRLGEDGLRYVAIAIWRELAFWDDEEEE
jgi:hypothetical protein